MDSKKQAPGQREVKPGDKVLLNAELNDEYDVQTDMNIKRLVFTIGKYSEAEQNERDVQIKFSEIKSFSMSFKDPRKVLMVSDDITDILRKLVKKMQQY